MLSGTATDTSLTIPKEFDSRTKWPECPSIGDIKNQGNCQSCYAVSSAAAIAICIGSGGKTKVAICALDIMSCCKDCGDGCTAGGTTWFVYEYWKSTGIPTGGNYQSSDGCSPYPFAGCVRECAKVPEATPKCVKTCASNYKTKYDDDRYFAHEIHHVGKNVDGKSQAEITTNMEEIQREIMTKGPVTASHGVYEDLKNYKSGVYKHVEGKLNTTPTVKLIGWGVDADKPYWLIANSYGTDYGEKGLMRFWRGSNHCRIESTVITGTFVGKTTRRRRAFFSEDFEDF